MEQDIETKVEKTKFTPNKNNVLIILICVLLSLLVAFNIYDHVVAFEKSKAAKELVENQQEFIFDMFDKYQKAAYDNPDLETIYEQQLIASEYIILGLQVISIQNSQIIDLLASTP